MEKSNLPYNVKNKLDKFVACVKGIYTDDLISITLYGSAASGEYAGKYSNINLAVVLKETSIASIKKAAPLVSKSKFSIIIPIFFTERYIKNSADVFPIEFFDMKENRSVLYGKDVFKDLHIDIKNLRFQCEQELKSKILNIKKLYLRSRNKFILKNVLFKSITSILHILRNLVRLKGKEPSYKKECILDEISKEFAVDVSCLRKILDAKNKNLRLKHKDLDELFACFIEALENISDKIDRLQ